MSIIRQEASTQAHDQNWWYESIQNSGEFASFASSLQLAVTDITEITATSDIDEGQPGENCAEWRKCKTNGWHKRILNPKKNLKKKEGKKKNCPSIPHLSIPLNEEIKTFYLNLPHCSPKFKPPRASWKKGI